MSTGMGTFGLLRLVIVGKIGKRPTLARSIHVANQRKTLGIWCLDTEQASISATVVLPNRYDVFKILINYINSVSLWFTVF